MKDLKRQYREAFNELKEHKNEASFNQKAIDNAKTQLVNDFEIWYADTFATQPGTSMQIVVQNAGFSAHSFKSDNLGIDELSVPARSAKSFLWQAPEQEGEYSLYCTDCKLKDQLFKVNVDKTAKKFIAIMPKVEDSM